MRAEGKERESQSEKKQVNESDKQHLSTTDVTDFNASNITEVFVGNDRSLVLSVPVVNDDIDEVDELFVLLLELVSAENPDRVDLSERNISLARINDDDGECVCVCVCVC